MADPFSVSRFTKTYDKAAESQESPITNIGRSEFEPLRTQYEATKGRLFDGHSDALDSLKGKDPALAATLETGGTYDDYMNRVYQRMDQHQPLPGGWKATPGPTTNSGKYFELPTEVKAQVLALRETFDLNMEATSFNKPGMLKGLQATDEWKAAAAALKPYGLSVADALRESRVER